MEQSWINFALDIGVFIIPLSQLGHLNLHWKQKISVGAMFFLGTLATIAGFIRLSWILQFQCTSKYWNHLRLYADDSTHGSKGNWI
ncbi:hypothetical protein VHEMI02473 [[Torrubiella] hemipterigena]|uniref:Rhodopsin domain-containing protein n=1 Tax=[Torrubiella] hemipterigena TaxID=1531966 RepID=A0A0A1T7Z3_9HYPO|nr:hypothetical protein VHEMI02473 [[Torrubiella] hemipterigena]